MKEYQGQSKFLQNYVTRLYGQQILKSLYFIKLNFATPPVNIVCCLYMYMGMAMRTSWPLTQPQTFEAAPRIFETDAFTCEHSSEVC